MTKRPTNGAAPPSKPASNAARTPCPTSPTPVAFDTWISGDAPKPGLPLIASLAPGAKPFRETLRAHPHTTAATLLVGPEGDFTPRETKTALAAGFLPVTLGHIVLRVETATLFCLSALRYEFSGKSTLP